MFTKIENILGEKIIEKSTASGGCIANSLVIQTEEGQKYFIKHYSNPKVNESEANGLEEIYKTKTIRVPKVIYFNNDFLILEFINSNRKVKNFSELLGKKLAQMHRVTSKYFGFYEDNFIGSTPQKNTPQSENWIEFYFENRLEFQFKLAEKKGYTDEEFRKLFFIIEKNIDKILGGSENIPSLLHGDLWNGNYIVDEKGEPCLIDPAVYYGNREAELAMTKLFGGFDTEFYEAYNQEFPLKENWQYRENIYKLYHVLNHLNLFGLGYYGKAKNLMSFYVNFT